MIYIDGDQNFQFENNSLTNIDHEQDENDQISMPIIYKKRVRTKFTQEQVVKYFTKIRKKKISFYSLIRKMIS